MNMQDLFDKGVGGVLRQGGRSMNENGFCAYRGENGFKCPVGHCIPDEDYKPEMESKTIYCDLVYKGFSRSFGGGLGSEELQLLSRMQRAHDNNVIKEIELGFIKQFYNDCKITATEFNLHFNFDLDGNINSENAHGL